MQEQLCDSSFPSCDPAIHGPLHRIMQGALYVTDNAAYTWQAAVQETVDATLNRTVSSGGCICCRDLNRDAFASWGCALQTGCVPRATRAGNGLICCRHALGCTGRLGGIRICVATTPHSNYRPGPCLH